MYKNLDIKKAYDPPGLPAPHIEPAYCPNNQSISLEYLYNCKHSCIYVWMKQQIVNNLESFWFYPTEIFDNIIEGYHWDGTMWKPHKFSIHDMNAFY